MADSNNSPEPPPSAEADYESPEYLARRRAAVARTEGTAWQGVDASDPKGPAGHARGVRVSASLTSHYRRTHRNCALDITPDDVIQVLKDAGLTRWVLRGLHGYVGYLPQPRATQDVDILIPTSSKQQDAVDFRRMARTNYNAVDRDYLQRLGELVWADGGGAELERFFDIAQEDKPFPI